MLKPAFNVFDKYYSPKFKAYCASENFDGNEDVYYDDNAQIASALITAYEATGDRSYLDKGEVNVKFLLTGFDQSGNPGGVRWHVGKKGSNACTTAECGLAALRLARNLKGDVRVYTEFAEKCCRWIFDRLQDPDDFLICDGLEPVNEEKNEYNRNSAKWTYNQGTPISLCCMLYYVTRNDWYKQRAQELVSAVTNRNTVMFDRSTPRMESRYYHDSVYFYQLLAEGLADFVLYFGDKSPRDLVDRARDESLHMMSYVFRYLRDPNDMLYFQTLELFKINEHTYEQYKKITGSTRAFEPGQGERESCNDVPIEKRAMTKSLIGCAGAARIFFQSGRLFPHFSPQ